MRDFAAYNLEHGWHEGDLLLKKIGHRLKHLFPHVLCFRIHGDDFVVLEKKNPHIDSGIFDDLLEQSSISVYTEELDIEKNRLTNLQALEKIALHKDLA